MWKQLIRSVTETTTQVGVQFVHDPLSTTKKIRTKLGRRLPRLNQKRTTESVTRNISEARKLYETGQLTQIKHAKVSNIFQLLERNTLARAAKFQLDMLQSPISISTVRTDFQGDERPLYVLTSSLPYTQSGYTVRSHFILKALKRRGVPIEAITRSGYPSAIGTITSESFRDIETIRYRLNSHWFTPVSFERQNRKAVKGLVLAARSQKATILMTTTDFKNAIVVSRAAKELGIPWVYEIRGELEQTWLSRVEPELKYQAEQSEYFMLSQQQEKAARRSAASVFVISEQIRKEILRDGESEDKVHLLPNAVEQIDFSDGSKSNVLSTVPGLSSAYQIVGTVSAIVEYEGLDTLIKSLSYLPEHVHALVVGDGSDRLRLERLSEELELASRVHFVGKKRLDSIGDWYKSLDVFVVPRLDSQLCRNVTPIKAMQALALGIPVVASDLPALREVTGGFAEYVHPENPKELAVKLKSVLEKGGSRSENNDSLREWLETRTWDANASKIISIFQSI